LLVPGFGEPQFYSRAVVTTHGSAQLNGIQQNIEDVRTLSGQTATLSFWAKADSTRTISFFTQQNFGSGGSTTTTQTIGIATATTSWQRFTFTFDVPSVTGKTIGEGSSLMVSIRNNNSADGSTLDIWGVQLEAGSVATPFKRHAPSLQGELAACQRYYYRLTPLDNAKRIGVGYANSTTVFKLFIPFPTKMRVPPTSLEQSGTATDYSIVRAGTTIVTCSTIPGFEAATENNSTVDLTFASGLVAGEAAVARNVNTNAFLGWSAEL
jgi:hypothetical protein